jgi:hypothetical protein
LENGGIGQLVFILAFLKTPCVLGEKRVLEVKEGVVHQHILQFANDGVKLRILPCALAVCSYKHSLNKVDDLAS